MDGPSLQERFAPRGTCFGCGPANPAGLRIRSFPDGEEVVASWQPRPEHEAFAGALNGGVIGTLLDCHSNWTAIRHLVERGGLAQAPATVTAELAIRFLRPTPTDGPLTLRARVVEAATDRVTVEGTVEAGGRPTATSRAVFVVVGRGHPADHRWE